MIDAINRRDGSDDREPAEPGNRGAVRAVSEITGLRPLNARSLVLSTLLGTDPPVQPVRALVRLAELFGIADGTVRTALSRMVANGELVASDGSYRLVGPQLGRQAAQRSGRRPPVGHWDGGWHWIVVRAAGRSLTTRREFRRDMADQRFGELRPEVWLRPTNLGVAPTVSHDLLVTSGPMQGASSEDQRSLCRELWDLDGWAVTARSLESELDATHPILDVTDGSEFDDAVIVDTLMLSAATLRHLRADPVLPIALEPADWPGAALRSTFARFDLVFQRRLSAFLTQR